MKTASRSLALPRRQIGKATRDSELGLRNEPRQARARETFERILAAAAELLDEVGIDGFNTNLLASRAGVRVRSVYRYFPNKHAVVVTLAKRVVSQWDGWVSEGLRGITAADWRVGMGRVIDRYYEGVRSQPGHSGIRRAMTAVPELHQIDQEDNARIGELLARALCRISDGPSLPRARLVSRCLVESSVAVIDVALDCSPAKSKALIDELKAMHVAYIEALLE